MSKDLIGVLLDTLGAVFGALGRIVQMRDENAAKRALARLAVHGKSVSADAIAMDAARGVVEPEDS